jgi:hypothetical protein
MLALTGGVTRANVPDRVAAPCVPGALAPNTDQPLGLGQTTIEGGMWADWQRRNREVSLPLALERLATSGSLNNFKMAGGGAIPVTSPAWCSSIPMFTKS